MDLAVLGSFITAVIGILIAALTARSAASKDEMESLRKSVVLLQSENERLSKRLDAQDVENEDLKLKNYQLQAEITALTRKLEGAERALTERNGRVKLLEEEVETLRGKVARLEKRDTGELKN